MSVIHGSKGGGKGGGGGGSTRVAQESPNTLRSKTIARIIDVISEGEIEGPGNGTWDRSTFFEGTPLQNADNSYNFSGVAIDTRVGLPTQDYIPNFAAVESETNVGVEVLYDSPITRTITDADADAVRIKVRIPALTQQDTTNGDLYGTSVTFRLDINDNGAGWQPAQLELSANPITISGKTTSPYEASYRVKLNGDGPWDIRVTRISADSTSAALNNKTSWSTYTIIKDNKIQYVDTALVGLQVDAEQFAQSVPSRAYLIKGIKVKVPNNYNPETREYTGLWDGNFQTAWSDNPAWVLYDILTNRRYGLGDSIDASQVDKFGLYTIAQYCDELVPNGFGSQEPRFTFNGVINTREEAYKVLNSIASSFQGMLYWSSGLVVAAQDSPSDPTKLVTPANVIDGTFTYTGSSLKSRHSVALVTWNDPNDSYNPTVVVVEDPQSIQKFGWKPKEIAAYGCTSKGQAYRLGKWALDTEKHSTEVVSYRASFDHVDLQPGDIIAVQDPSYAGVRYGGRLASATVSTLTLDAPVLLTAGEDYTISVVMPDGTIEERDIVNPSGLEYTTIDLGSPLPEPPINGGMWVITGTDVAPRQFRVVSVVELEKNIYEVSALFHDPNKFARIEQNVMLEDIAYSAIPTGPIAAPINMTHMEYLYRTTAGVRSATTLSWTPSPDPRVAFYQIDVKRPNTDFYEGTSTTTGTSIDIYDTPSGVYSFRIRAVDNLGRKSPYLERTVELLGLLNPPANVTNFRIQNVGDQAMLTWNPNEDLDLSHYVVKYSSSTSNPQWGAGVVLVDRVPKEATSLTVATLVGSYMIKAVDTSGLESEDATFITTNVLDIEQYNVIIELKEEDGPFLGEKTNCTVVSGSLKLADASTIGVYDFESHVDLGYVFTSRVVTNLIANGENPDEVMSTWVTLAGVQAMSNADPSNWGVEIQVRTTHDDPSGGSPNWTGWSPITIGDYTARAFEFRAILSSLNGFTVPNVSALGVTIDMPDRIERGEDAVTEPDGSYVVLFTRAFKAIPVIGISAQDMNSGDYYTITAKTEDGFMIQFFDSNGIGVPKTFDWSAAGYGAEMT